MDVEKSINDPLSPWERVRVRVREATVDGPVPPMRSIRPFGSIR